jgi:hypothetical protein
MNTLGWIAVAYLGLFILINGIGIIYIKKCTNPSEKEIQRKLERKWKKRSSPRNY